MASGARGAAAAREEMSFVGPRPHVLAHNEFHRLSGRKCLLAIIALPGTQHKVVREYPYSDTVMG